MAVFRQKSLFRGGAQKKLGAEEILIEQVLRGKRDKKNKTTASLGGRREVIFGKVYEMHKKQGGSVGGGGRGGEGTFGGHKSYSSS